MGISIETMVEADLNQVKNLEIECMLSPWTKKDYLSELNRKDSITLTAKINEHVIGFIVARLIIGNFNNSIIDQNKTKYVNSHSLNESELYNIAVNPSFRKKGVGTLLINKFIEHIDRYKVQNIFLEVRASNTEAIKFYTSNQFDIVGKRIRFYKNPTEDAFIMRRSRLY